MKRILIAFIVGISFIQTAAAQDPAYSSPVMLQPIVKAEYYFDGLVDFGNGTDIPITTSGTEIGLPDIIINTSLLTEGIHHLYIRTQTADGKWCITNHKQITVQNDPPYVAADPLPQIVKAEYYFDAFIDFGTGIDIPIITPGTYIDLNDIIINTSQLTEGVHHLYIRTQDANGKWSITNHKQITVQNDPPYAAADPLPQIVKAEYYFDAFIDFGTGIDIPIITPGTYIDLNDIIINTSQLTEGVHHLYIRTQDANGKWSLTNHKQLTAQNDPPYAASNSLPQIVKAEYYFDAFIDFGTGIDIPITTTGTYVDLNDIIINTSQLTEGIHHLYIRTQDANGKWSITNQRQFTVENDPPYASSNSLPQIVKAEYYFDDLVDFGNGIDIPITTTGTNINLENIIINTNGLSTGPHYLYIRTKDANGRWSITNQRLLNVTNQTPYVDFENGDYYIKPGPGNALVLSGETLANFNYNTAPASHAIFNDGIYFPRIDHQGNNIWVRLQHIAADPNGTSVGYNVPYTAASPFRPETFGGWWGFLYQFEIYKDGNINGIPSYTLDGLYPTNVIVESNEILSPREWVSLKLDNPEASNWNLNSINYTGDNTNSNPGFSAVEIPYDNYSGFSPNFSGVQKELYAIDELFDENGNYAEFRVNASSVSQFKYGFESPDYNHFQGIRLYVGYPDIPAAPANDDCTNAVTLVPTTDQSFNGTTGTLTSATASNFTDCDHKTTYDVWYKFTATSKYHRIVLKNADVPGNMRFQLYGGNCSSFYTIACVLNSRDSTVYDATDLRVGETYYLKVYNRSSFITPNSFDIGIVSPAFAINKGLNILTNASFETPPQPYMNYNNFAGSSFNGWATKLGGIMGIIRVNGTGFFAAPDSAASGRQYVDMVGTNDTLYQAFSLSSPTKIFFSGQFSNQARQQSNYLEWTAFCGIVDANNLLVAKSDIMNFKKSLDVKTWYQLSGISETLPAGNYRYIAYMSDFSDFDNAFAQANFNCPLLSQPATSISSNDADNIICDGSSITLTANGAVLASGASYAWYEGSCGDATLLGSSSSLTLTPSSGTHTYYVRVEESCGYTSCVGVTVSVFETPSISISSNYGANNVSICGGTPVVFTAYAYNTGSNPVYQWKLNGIEVGSNSPDYSNSNWQPTNIVTCSINNGTNCSAISNNIVVTVYTIEASVSISADKSSVCANGTVNFTATAVNAGSSPQFKWKKNGTIVLTTSSPFYSAIGFTADYSITCEMVSSLGCNILPAISNAIAITVNPTIIPTVSIAITSGTNPDCSGDPVTFTATAVNGGTSAIYQWYVGGNPVGINADTYTVITPSNNDIVSCTMISNLPCANPVMATSNAITIKASALSPSVGIGYNGANPTCANGSIQFIAFPQNGGTSPVYQWKLNRNNIITNVGTNSNIYVQTGFVDGDQITVTINNNEPCATPSFYESSPVAISVYDVSTASLSIYGPESICSGTLATYIANPLNAGPNPTYEWKLQRNNVVTIVSTDYYYQSNTLMTGDLITLSIQIDAVCATPIQIQSSNSITITITQSVTPTITIAANNPLTSLANIFTTTITNGGANPHYYWKKNGLDVGFNNNTYLDLSLVNGDVITCTLESDAPCATLSVITSNTLMVGTPPYCIPNTIYPGNQPCTYAWIDNVILGTTINHVSGCNGFYSDYTATDTLRSAAGQTVDFTISAGDNGNNYGMSTSIYIDYNQDGDFEDAGELVIDNSYMYVGYDATGTFVVPSSLTAGSYRIRVICDSYVSSPCITNYGEAEDYILQVTYCTPGPIYGNTACSYSWISNVILGATVNQPSGCSGFYTDYTGTDTLKTTAGQTVNFVIATADAGINYARSCNIYVDYNSDGDFEDPGEKVADNINFSTGNDAIGSFVVPQLILPASYRLRVISNNTVTSPCETDYGEAEDYILQIPQPDYCIPVISNPCDMWISNVTIGTINNTSIQPVTCDQGGYTDYSSLLSTIAAPGQVVNFSLTGHSTIYYEPWQNADIYIDFNNDGDFDDADERVVADFAFYTDNVYSGSFTIPAAQPYGYYRMRVKSYNYYESQTGSCGNNTSGEIEDYTLIINCVPNGSDVVVKGNDVNINDGDLSPDLADFTDFGNVVFNTAFTRTFFIENPGTNTLNISGVTITGNNAGAFTVVSQPAAVVVAGGSTSFTIQFNTPYQSPFTAVMHINTDNCDKKDYDIAIVGRGVCPSDGPEINVQGNAIDIAVFDNSPDVADNTDFGIVTSNNTLSKTFTIQNTGNQPLNITVAETSVYNDPNQFVVTSQPQPIVAPGGSTTFTLTFMPAGSGQRYSWVRIISNDCDESYFVFLVGGSAECPVSTPEVNVKGNGIDIVDGDNTPDDADNTNFGVAALNTSVSKIFVIENTGSDPLAVSGVTFTGADAADFSVTAAPASSVAPGSSTVFTVQFLSTVSGLKSAIMHINNSDCDEGDYDIAIRGTDGTACTPLVAQPCSYMYISNVTIGTINNNSACSYGTGYSDYTTTLSNIAAPGETVQFSASAYGNQQKVNVYVDYNKDGDFDDAGELVLNDLPMSPDFGNGPVNATGSFVVPQTQAPDNYRVRVISEYAYYSLPTPCYTYYGEAEDYTLVVQTGTSIAVNLKAFLQGYYIGNNTMQPVLNNQAVLNSLPNETDTITIELHDPVTYALVDAKQAVLLTDGTVYAAFDQPAGPYYIAVKHRNSIQTWSADPVDCPTQLPYDFSIAAVKAMGDNQVEVEPGVWALFTGDINQDDYIDGNDFPIYDQQSASGGLYDGTYTMADMNGDGFVDGNDFPVFDFNSFNGVSAVHP